MILMHPFFAKKYLFLGRVRTKGIVERSHKRVSVATMQFACTPTEFLKRSKIQKSAVVNKTNRFVNKLYPN